jgi:hypothetical protein
LSYCPCICSVPNSAGRLKGYSSQHNVSPCLGWLRGRCPTCRESYCASIWTGHIYDGELLACKARKTRVCQDCLARCDKCFLRRCTRFGKFCQVPSMSKLVGHSRRPRLWVHSPVRSSMLTASPFVIPLFWLLMAWPPQAALFAAHSLSLHALMRGRVT